MSKHTVKICDRCHCIVAYKENLVFGKWEVVKEFIESKHIYIGSEHEHGEAFPIPASEPYHICAECLNKGWEQNFNALLKCFKEINKHNKKQEN